MEADTHPDTSVVFGQRILSISRLPTPFLPDILNRWVYSQGSTALHWACYGGNLELVEWLVKDAGAKVGQKNKVMCTGPVAVLPMNEQRCIQHNNIACTWAVQKCNTAAPDSTAHLCGKLHSIDVAVCCVSDNRQYEH